MKKVRSDLGPIYTQINKSSSLSISLRCLSHPITFLSICLLLLNDHVLKQIAPSHLTGKLSDFAGLFFFPFLLAIVISLPFDHTNTPPHKVARFAFAITAGWFTLIKTLPVANSLMVDILEHILGSAQIVRDPTDLLALIVLWPAWRHWRSIEKTPSNRSANISAYIALGLASLATLATSPCPGTPQISRLAQYDDVVYASGFGYYASWDGTDWEYTNQIPSPVEAEFMQPMELPKVLCVPEDPQTCYRIAGDEQVLVSINGGNTWKILWRVPPGRHYFMDRSTKEAFFLSCPKDIDLGPYDMVLVGSGANHELIVAMGTEGVLVKNRNGEVLQQPVVDVIPTPLTGFDLSIIRFETLATIILALITLLGMSKRSWNKISIRAVSEAQENQDRRWVRSPMNKSLSVAFLASILVYIFLDSTLYIPMVVTPLAVIAFVLSWIRMSQVAQEHSSVKIAAFTTVLTSVSVLLGGWSPFALWTLGIPPFYWLAVGLALLLVTGSLLWGIRRINQVAQ